mgnify:CR=1 FL=1
MKKLKVRVFDCSSVEKLEEQVNGFLDSQSMVPGFEFVEIKFNSYPYGEDRTDYHSAMVIYKM